MTSRSIAASSVAILVASALALPSPASARVDPVLREGTSIGRATVRAPVAYGLSTPVRRSGVAEPAAASARIEVPRHVRPGSDDAPTRQGTTRIARPRGAAPSSPALLTHFDGIANADNPSLVLPPDVSGDVGPNHYVQMLNVSFAVYEKDGTAVQAPTPLQDLWNGLQGTGEPCENSEAKGDPIVLYDELADRWLFTQFAFDSLAGPFYQCIAVSTDETPEGSYHAYQYLWHDTILNDYPKFGVWPDGYYMTVNQFTQPGDSFVGVGTAVFERDLMLTGDQDARMISVDLSDDLTLYGTLPADLDGPVLPPAGAPNYVAMWDDNSFGYSPDQLRIFEMHTDWTTGTARVQLGSTIDLGAAGLGIDTNICGPFEAFCIPQGGSGQLLDALNDRMMWRLAYRNFGTRESLVTTHTVDAGSGRAGVRWYEIGNPADAFIRNAGTHSPGSADRWLGSAAIDADGNIAIGYSASSDSQDPDIRYAARARNDGAMRGEITMMNGTGSQTDPSGRWGDYSTMSVDPGDHCTFWYTNEYYASNSAQGWRTHIGSFSFESAGLCDGLALGSISGTVTPPQAGITVRAGTMSAVTDAGGTYAIDPVPAGTYAVTAFGPGRRAVTQSTTVAEGEDDDEDFTLAARTQRNADFDGDGFGDLAIGAPNDLREGKAAGAVNVLYGSADGLRSGGDQLLAQNVAGVGEAPQTGDAFGYSLATGDFDGDDFDDLAVGAPFESFNGRSSAGVVHVFYGGASGLKVSDDQVWSQNSSGIANTAEEDDTFGLALAAGDFDLNGRDDLAIGVPGENNGRGAVNVLYGTADRLKAAGDQFFTQDSTGIQDTAEVNDGFGASLAAANLGDSAREDLAIGVPLENHSGHVDAGAVNVIYGKGTGGLHRDGDQFWHQDRTGIRDAAEDGDQFGHDLAAANFDATAKADLAIGIWRENHSGRSNAGAVGVLYGRSGGLASTGNEFWHRGVSGVLGSPGANDTFGFELAAADFDGDGRADLAIGAPGDNFSSGRTDAGSVNVLYGSGGGLSASGDDLWTQDVAGTGVRAQADAFRFGLPISESDGDVIGTSMAGVEERDLAAYGLARGDFDGDGFADLAIGVPRETLMTGSLADVKVFAGAVTVLRGGPADLTSAGTTTWCQDSSGVEGAAADVEYFGYALAG